MAAEDDIGVKNHGKVFGESNDERRLDDKYPEDTDESLAKSLPWTALKSRYTNTHDYWLA